MKFVSAIVIAATLGTCSVGGERKVPPSEAELRAREGGPPTPGVEADGWAGLPDECRELAADCTDCDEVESMRRQIELKKCVPVCGAYLEQLAVIETLPPEGVALLTSEAMCGKQSASCSAVQESACQHALAYASTTESFRQVWASEGDQLQGDALVSAVQTQFVTPHLGLHEKVIDWAVDNEYDPASLIRAGGRLMEVVGAEQLDGATAALSKSDDRRALAVETLLGMALAPGDPTTFKGRRAAAEAPLQQ